MNLKYRVFGVFIGVFNFILIFLIIFLILFYFFSIVLVTIEVILRIRWIHAMFMHSPKVSGSCGMWLMKVGLTGSTDQAKTTSSRTTVFKLILRSRLEELMMFLLLLLLFFKCVH